MSLRARLLLLGLSSVLEAFHYLAMHQPRKVVKPVKAGRSGNGVAVLVARSRRCRLGVASGAHQGAVGRENQKSDSRSERTETKTMTTRHKAVQRAIDTMQHDVRSDTKLTRDMTRAP